MSAPNTRRGPQGGPPLLAPALAYGALLIASVAVWIGAPQAGASAASTLSYAQAHTGQMHAEAVLVFGAALPLAIWTATVYRRLRTLGVTAPGAVIGLPGGILPSASLAMSGLVTWVAAIGMVSTLTLLTSALDFTLPIARFGGLIFIVAASVLLPASRHRLTAAA